MFTTTPTSSNASSYSDADGLIEQTNNLKQVITDFVVSSTKAKTIIENANKALISMNDSALTLQRSMGGVVVGADGFREKLIESYHNSLDLNASFKDVTDAVDGLAEGMGKMVNPSQKFLENTVATSKATGLTTKELGTLSAELSRYTLNQEKTLEKIHDVAVAARKSGLDSKALITEVGKNLKSISGFGFKSGVEGLTKMAKQAAILRTNMESIGSKKVAGDALDPEKAIELAAAFQMMGGAVGKLSDPFQLLHMAQTDVAGIQDALIESTKSAFKFNKETGQFDIATQDMYRLREQAALTGANLEDLVNTGREAAKLDMLEEKFSLKGIDEDSKNLIAGLAQFESGGKVTVDLPGFEEGNRDLAQLMEDQDFELALKNYQKASEQSEKELAISQMTITENQAKDINIIKEMLLNTMTDTQRTDLINQIKDTNNKLGESAKSAATGAAPTGVIAVQKIDTALNNTANQFTITTTSLQQFNNAVNNITSKIANTTGSEDPIDVSSVQDLFIPEGGRPKVLSEGKIYQGIVGDEVAMGTNLSDAFTKVSTLQDLMSAKSKEGGTSQNIDGNLKIDINVGGRVDGDKNADISKIFSSPQFQKQLMDMVLYKMKDYQKQQGVL
jgi:hypothetical protein